MKREIFPLWYITSQSGQKTLKLLQKTLQDFYSVSDHLVALYIKWYKKMVTLLEISQPAFTSSKLTIETLEQGVKYVPS